MSPKVKGWLVSLDALVLLYKTWVLSPTGAGSLVHMEDPEEHCLQFTAAKSEESMDILRSFFTTLDFFVTMWTDVASYM